MSNPDVQYTLEDYMNMPYAVVVVYDGEDWLATIAEFRGCMTAGDNGDDILENMEIAKRLWLESMLGVNEPIPLPNTMASTPPETASSD